MGITATKGTHDRAPEYCSSSIGIPAWSGVAEKDFTQEMREQLIAFIKVEARRQGWNDCKNDRLDVDESIFHPEFFDGAVHRMWAENYMLGVDEYKVQKTTPQDANYSDWAEYNEMIAEEFRSE